MLTGEVGIDPVLMIPESRAARPYRQLLPLLEQLQVFKQGALETGLGEDKEHSIAESLQTGMGLATDIGSPYDDEATTKETRAMQQRRWHQTSAQGLKLQNSKHFQGP